MVADRLKSIMWGGLLRTVESHDLTHRIASHLYRRYDGLRKRSEFHSRMRRINADEYLDVSHKPDLNVILLVVDSLRNSRLSSQGYFRQTTPNC